MCDGPGVLAAALAVAVSLGPCRGAVAQSPTAETPQTDQWRKHPGKLQVRRCRAADTEGVPAPAGTGPGDTVAIDGSSGLFKLSPPDRGFRRQGGATIEVALSTGRPVDLPAADLQVWWVPRDGWSWTHGPASVALVVDSSILALTSSGMMRTLDYEANGFVWVKAHLPPPVLRALVRARSAGLRLLPPLTDPRDSAESRRNPWREVLVPVADSDLRAIQLVYVAAVCFQDGASSSP